MAFITPTDFHALAEAEGEACVSIYVPTHVGGPETREDPIAYKNALAEAEAQLTEVGIRTADTHARFEPLHELYDDVDFWQHQGPGTGVFLVGDEVRGYRVPFEVPTLTVTGPQPHVVPLLPLISRGARYYLLALSKRSVRLFEGRPYGIREMDVEDLPENFEEATRWDDPERQLQFHTETPQTPRGDRAAMFHGQGVGTDDARRKEPTFEFCHAVARAVQNVLADHEAPLVLAATDPLVGLYREANLYDHLHEEVVQGNPDRRSAADLHRDAARILKPCFEACRRQAVDQYKSRAGGQEASDDVETIVTAAHDGRIESLLVSLGDHRWGRFDPEARSVEVHPERQPGDEDLLNRAAVGAYRAEAALFGVPPEEMPDGAVAAATLRWPLKA